MNAVPFGERVLMAPRQSRFATAEKGLKKPLSAMANYQRTIAIVYMTISIRQTHEKQILVRRVGFEPT